MVIFFLFKIETFIREGHTLIYKKCSFQIQKEKRRVDHAVKETDFLRLKRTRLGLGDFEMLKIIGRGAFGEVRIFCR